MLIRFCFFDILYKPHTNYFLNFLAESFGNLFVMIRSLLLMIYEMLTMFTKLNLNFGFLSLIVRRIRSFDKRKALFHWCMKDKADIIFLQETYTPHSTPQ